MDLALLINAMQDRILLERALYSWIFLNLILRIVSNAHQWKDQHDAIQHIADHFRGIQLPHFNLRSRSSAKKEKQLWFRNYLQLNGRRATHIEKMYAEQYILFNISHVIQIELQDIIL